MDFCVYWLDGWLHLLVAWILVFIGSWGNYAYWFWVIALLVVGYEHVIGWLGDCAHWSGDDCSYWRGVIEFIGWWMMAFIGSRGGCVIGWLMDALLVDG
jgi:hypothetical protein